jgi:hypothetical protein
MDMVLAKSYITTEIQYFPKMTHTPGSQDEDFSKPSGLHTALIVF